MRTVEKVADELSDLKRMYDGINNINNPKDGCGVNTLTEDAKKLLREVNNYLFTAERRLRESLYSIEVDI